MFYHSNNQIFCRESFEVQYASALKLVMERGIETSDRTGTGRCRIPNVNFAFPCMDWGLPVLKGKAVYPKMAIKEISWIMMGFTNISFLEKHRVTYWREWADANGDLGPVYGKQFRDFNGVDQLKNCINKLINDPYSSQNIINLWNASDLPDMKLPPCHFSYTMQVLPDADGVPRLNIHLVQRSADAFLGVPYNAIMVSYMLMLLSSITGIKPGWVFWTLQDFHVYLNHFNQVEEYLSNVAKNKYGTIGESTILDNECLPIFNKNIPHKSMKMLDATDTLDYFFDECDECGFKNIIIEKVDGYGKIEAEIAV